jgi:hypothetical protein
MITILSLIFGFLGSAVPELFKYLKDKQDKMHEIAILQLQMQHSREAANERLEEIESRGDIEQYEYVYKPIRIKWVEAFNSTVRPVIAYCFFAVYACCKIAVVLKIQDFTTLPLSELYAILWKEEDSALFAGIMSFYFSNRSFQKLRS